MPKAKVSPKQKPKSKGVAKPAPKASTGRARSPRRGAAVPAAEESAPLLASVPPLAEWTRMTASSMSAGAGDLDLSPGIYEVVASAAAQPNVTDKLIVQLTRWVDATTYKAVILAGKTKESDELRGMKTTVHCCEVGQCVVADDGFHVNRARPITSAGLTDTTHWARMIATRLDRPLELRAERRVRLAAQGPGLSHGLAQDLADPLYARLSTVASMWTEADWSRVSRAQLLELVNAEDTPPKVMRLALERLSPGASEESQQRKDPDAMERIVDLLDARSRSKRKRRRQRSEDSDEDSEHSGSEESVRRVKGTARERLLDVHARHPGLVAKRTVRECVEATGVELTMGTKLPDMSDSSLKKTDLNKLPSLFRLYVRQYQTTTVGLGQRSLREMQTLALVLDKLFAGRPAEAADVAVQRLKAVQMAHCDRNWERASFLELLPLADGTLASRAELLGSQKEMKAAKQMYAAGEPGKQKKQPKKKPKWDRAVVLPEGQ
jgi:hypothetical protein